jgi:hydroxymethylpyrimidine/phosphomethylpyrimidine kinase
MEPVVVLSIAGSDSGGGAGIQADLHSFAAAGTFGTTAITAITAQNTVGVTAVKVLEPELVIAQMDAVLSDFSVAAIKTGMLGNAAVVAAVAARLEGSEIPLVVDPVLISTTGSLLLDEGGLEAYRDCLLHRAQIVTPNRDELAALLGLGADAITTTEELRVRAIQLSTMTNTIVVAKGGHVRPVDGRIIDLVVFGEKVRSLPQPFIATANDHGTGCSFAAALAANLGKGLSSDDAIDQAQRFVHRALQGASGWNLGQGHGPIDHHGLTVQLQQSRVI